MIENEIVARIVADIREELQDDYVGLWVVPWCVRRAVPGADDGRVQRLGEEILASLLTDEAVMGDLDGETGKFRPWSGDGFAVAVKEWRALGRDPDIGEIGWIAALPLDG